jgi:hypothetical protein
VLSSFLGIFSGTLILGASIEAGNSRADLYYPIVISVTRNRTMFVLGRDNYRVLKW